jgi:hypothetical protein
MKAVVIYEHGNIEKLVYTDYVEDVNIAFMPMTVFAANTR